MSMENPFLKVKNYLFDSDYRFIVNAVRGKYNSYSDEEYLKRMFKAKTGRNLDLDNPQTYNEKLQWLKIHDHNPEYTVMVDKYAVKEYVAKRIGEQYIIPTLGVWERFEDIDFDKLPDQFVLKCTHDSGGLIICKDKAKLDLSKAKAKIEKCLKRNYFYYGREWPYKDVKPRVIAEQYMIDKSEADKPLNDYKIYTFAGKAKMIMINTDRGIATKADYFDRDYNYLDFIWGYPHSDNKPNKPQNFEKMIELAELLAKGTSELRVDFYDVDGKIYFGELTFFDGSGFDPIVPIEWDYKIGSWVDLSMIKK